MDQQPDHQEQADRLEREAEKLEEESKRVGERIEDDRQDWDAKEGDISVPGAQPDFEEALADDEEEES